MIRKLPPKAITAPALLILFGQPCWADLCASMDLPIQFYDGTSKDLPLGDFKIHQAETACEASDSVFGTRRIECYWDNPDVMLFDAADAERLANALAACPSLTLNSKRQEPDEAEYEFRTPRNRKLTLGWDEGGIFLETRE